jgi:HEAT repeat protein
MIRLDNEGRLATRSVRVCGSFYLRVVFAWLCVVATGWSAVAQTGDSHGDHVGRGGHADAGASVEDLFEDFLHYSVLGRFQMAETHALELLGRSDLDPVELLRLSEENARSMETLLILVERSSISDTAMRVLDKIREGEHVLRKDDQRIRANIEKLGGLPQAEFNATQHLIDSGEYAVPRMVQVLLDRRQEGLWTRVIRALPKLGGSAVNPLVESLSVSNESVRQTLIGVLGEIGSARAIPYLQRLGVVDGVSPESRAAAAEAIDRIARNVGRGVSLGPADEFVRLGSQFYDEIGSAAADARLDEANVWYWDSDQQLVYSVPVPTRIFGQVMAMRCGEHALLLDSNNDRAVALWLPANIRRESRLGLDVESGDANEVGVTDPTRPAGFPRAVYFTSIAGAKHAQMSLGRAIGDMDAQVALGSIAGLSRVAGASSLVGDVDGRLPLVAALQFPDHVVRVRAALALGRALPRSLFSGSDLVVPVLSRALVQTGESHYLVVDGDTDERNRMMDSLRGLDTRVVGSADLSDGIALSEKAFAVLDGLIVSSKVVASDFDGAIESFRDRYELAMTPIVVVVYPEHAGLFDEMADEDAGVSLMGFGSPPEAIRVSLSEASSRLGRTPLMPEAAMEMALAAAGTLERIATNGQSSLDAGGAERALIEALESTSEELQTATIGVLSLLPTADAQRAIARVGLDGDQLESLRVSAFAGLSESARRFGSMLGESMIEELLSVAMDDANLRLRTAASRAVGALNLGPSVSNRSILQYSRG